MIRAFDHSEFPLERLLEAKRETVTVVLPAREVAATVGRAVAAVRSLDPLVDQELVVDASSGCRFAPATRWRRRCCWPPAS